jgi:hypothetical protein
LPDSCDFSIAPLVRQEISVTIRFLFCMLLLPLGSVHAQGAPAPQPTDPAAPVPAVTYRSVFSGLPTGVEAGREDWKKANKDVGQFTRGHVDILKWEQQQAPVAPAAKPGTAPATAAHPHKH